ncbi:unnamed protein product [Symbiodinium sp. CCMP2592]|nr:unnamed protein product [Symbiodinium sp. CCMP2592]
MVSRTELEEFSRYIQCSLLSLVRGASTEARKDVDSARADFLDALQSFRDETLEALTALHERADLLLENQFRLQTQFLILQQRITRLEGTPECTDGAVAPARAKAANDQGGVGEFTFPPSPPLGVNGLAGDVPLPQVFPGCGESSAGSFSRVSFGSECVENDLHLPPLELPEDWEDDAPETATARTPMDLESVERSNREVASLMRDIFGSDDSHVENVESRTASASAAPCEQAASSIPDLDQAMSIAHADASADISLAASGEFVSTAGVVDDALGSFVGGLVKQDVARFGRLDDGLKLPWESEFSKLLFDPDCVWDPLQGRKQDSIFPPITHNAQAAHRPSAGPKEAPSGSIFAWAIALGAAARDPAAERERKREQGIGMWSRLVLRYSECCSLYECVSQGLSGREAGYEDVLVAVSAAVGVKSPHTIHKRAASFWTSVRWLDVHEPLAPSRLHEVQVWNFVQFLKETSAPASKAASVLSAFRFAHFVLGFRLSGIVDSRRIAGATEQQLVNVRKLRQAKDLTVSQVLELHARLELTARLEQTTHCMLVFEVSQHKGARKVQLKTKLLPILVPMIGVHGKCWIDEALTAFRNAGRSLTSVRGPLTLAPADESGVVSSRRSIASAEVGKMLRAFLGLPEEVTDPSAPRVTAYSLRGTCLGWGGKFGFDEDLKSILGRHASSVKTTQAIYSRELSAAPVRRLQDMIREVASGNFFPDNSRSSYFPRRAASDGGFPPKGAEKPNPVKVEVVSSDDSEAGNSASSDKECSDSSQSSQSSSSSSASDAVQPAVRRWKRAKVEVPDQVWYVNTSSGVLHLLASPDDVPMLLACGRPVSGNYREATRAEVSRGKDRESLRALADHGIDTLSKLAYSCGQPGTPLPQSEFDDFMSTVMPAALLGEKGSVKRLLFESQALLLNDLREQVTQPDKWSTRDVPTVERQKRMEAVRASIPGVVLEGSLEPSHGLLNAACRMEREGQLRYIAPEQCGTRMYEIQNVKAQSKVLSLEEGKLAISEEKGLPEVACGSALLLQEALKRRGVALQFAGVASYVAHERYVLKLFGHMGREPPPGYARTSVHQLLTADRQVWTRMIENEVSPKRSADGRYPVDRALLPTLETFDVTVALLPRKSEESKKRVATPHKPGVERDPKIAKPPKGKGKGKKGTWQPSVPEAIRKLGGVAETPDKKRICFSRNLPCGCTQDPCPKGLRVCALCFAPDHGLQECPKRKNGAAVTSVTSTSAGGQDSPMPDSIQLDTPGTISVEPVHPAEQFCSQLREGKLADVLQLITLLESETPARGQEAPNTFSWTSGAYAKGPLKGVRKHTSVFPACTRLLCKLVLQTFPDADFTAVVIYKNLQTALHVDVNNELGSQNYLIPITAFQGGEVWQKGPGNDIVQDELGFSLSGSLVRVADGPCTLNPRETHCTMPWTGDRVLLVAFKPNHAASLSSEYRRRLLQAGFPESAFDSASCSQGRDSTCPRGVVPAHLDELPSKPCDNSACITGAVPDPVTWCDPLVIELFSGSGRVTACLKQLGLSAVGVDADKRRSISTCLQADLATPKGQELCMEWLSSPRLAGLFVTPPAHLTDATGQFLAAALLHVLGRGAVCVLAQAGDGTFWKSDCWTKVSSNFTFVSCHECAYEGNHLSTTIFAVTDRSFSKLARFCPGSPGSPCRQERMSECPLHGAYPVRLAMQLACCFAQHFVQKGWRSPPQSFDAFDPRLEVPMSRALAGAQPRASKIPPLVSEHQRVIVLQHPPGLVLPCQPMQRLSKPWPVPPQCGATLAHIPAKAQLLRHVPIVQDGGKELVKVDSWEMAWGLPWEPEQFMRKAAESCHPRSMGSVLPAPLNDTLESLDKLGDAEVSALRARVIKEWLHLATSLSSNEAELKASMHPDVREITASKRILLWEALLKKYDYPDLCVSSLLKEGVPLVGHAPISGVFKPKFKPMQATPKQVREDSKVFREKVKNSLKTQDPALAAEVCTKTEKELEAGWIVGPMCESSLCDGILVSRRFGIQQGQKVRCIDNLTSSGVNLAVQAYEAPQPQSTDVVASTCLRLLKSIKKRAGKVLFKILGKAFDLTAAYRQMPVHPDTDWAAYICFVHPDTNERVYFRMKAMPFGSSMAVYAFLRISHSLWFLGAKALLLPWSSFFDDFVTFATTGCSASAEASVTAMFKLLGWAFAESGEKSNDFAECFQALGIMVDLRACLDGTISFKNTAKRVSEIKAFVGKVLESGRLPHHEALRLRGRCQFADSQIFGRTGKKCLGLVTAHAYGFDEVISRELRTSLERFLLRLEDGAPRLIKILEGGSWHVYTDASYEPGAGNSFCGLGGVLVDPNGLPRKFFSFVLSEAQKNFLGEQNSAQIIFQAEMLAMAVALDVWLEDLTGHTAIFFVDNNGVRDAAISANARASVARRLLESFLQKEHSSAIIPWFARVPSPSNPADEPSRVECDSLNLLGVQLLRSNVSRRVDSCLKDVQGLK